MTLLAQTLSKTYDSTSPLPNEDRLMLQPPHLIALADGAGGTGILCGEWAEYLLSHLPTKPIISFEEFIRWFNNLTDDFADNFEAQIQHDSFQLRRFYEEGSSCTLAVVWTNKNTFHWLTFGDSHVFCYQNNNLKSHPFQHSEALSGGTYLLNWLSIPHKEGFKAGSFKMNKKSTCLLATDAISKHILQNFENNAHSFEHYLSILYKALQNQNTFKQYIKSNPTIEEDDYTLILSKR